MSATVHSEEAIRDAFLSGMMSNEIRQRLLENQDLTFSAAFERAQLLELAEKNANPNNAGYLQQTVPEPFNAAKLSSIEKRTKSSRKTSIQEGKCDYVVYSGAERCMFCRN